MGIEPRSFRLRSVYSTPRPELIFNVKPSDFADYLRSDMSGWINHEQLSSYIHIEYVESKNFQPLRKSNPEPGGQTFLP